MLGLALKDFTFLPLISKAYRDQSRLANDCIKKYEDAVQNNQQVEFKL